MRAILQVPKRVVSPFSPGPLGLCTAHLGSQDRDKREGVDTTRHCCIHMLRLGKPRGGLKLGAPAGAVVRTAVEHVATADDTGMSTTGRFRT